MAARKSGRTYTRLIEEIVELAPGRSSLAVSGKKKISRQYNIGEAKARLPMLVRETLAGTEVIIAKDNKPLVKLVPLTGVFRVPGTARGQIWMSPDFDEPLEDFKDYM